MGGRWKKGQSGNPKGRARKGKTLTEFIEKVGKRKDHVHPETGKRITKFEFIILKAFELAEGGDITSIKYIHERLEGRPIQKVEADVNTKEPVRVVFPDEMDGV